MSDDWDDFPTAPPAAAQPPGNGNGWDSFPTQPPSAIAPQPAAQPQPSATNGFMAPLRALGPDIGNEWRAGTAEADKGATNLTEGIKNRDIGTTAEGAGQYVLGGLQQFSAPITGTAKAIVGDPAAAVLPDTPAGRFAAKTLEAAAMMVGPGAVAKAATAAAKLVPEYGAAVKMLLNEGVNLTPGQIAQGVFKRGEEAVSSLPVLGSSIRSAQTESLNGFNKAVINRSLAPIGDQLPDDIASGHDAIKYANTAIGSKYDKLLPRLTFDANHPDFTSDLADLESQNAKRLTPDQQGKFEANFNDIMHRVGDDGTMTGRDYKSAESELSYISRNYMRSPDPKDHDYARSIDDLRGVLAQNLERTNPAYAPQLKNLNDAWSMFSRVQGAATRRAGSAAQFTPMDLLSSIKGSTTKGVFARGDGQLQNLAEAGQKVLPNALPNSGTPERGLWDLLVLGGAGAVQPSTYAGLGAGYAAYTKPAIRAINKVARGTPGAARAVVQAGKAAGPYVAGTAGAADTQQP